MKKIKRDLDTNDKEKMINQNLQGTSRKGRTDKAQNQQKERNHKDQRRNK